MEQPKEIYMLRIHAVIYKTPMIQNSEGKWTRDESYEEITDEVTVREWFEDENGVEIEMEEEK